MSRKTGPQRRTQLLEAAMGLFSARGFEGTSTRAIAEAAEVTEALIFHYFPTKLALFRAVIVEYGIQSMHPAEPHLTEDMPLPEMLTNLLNTYIDTLWKNRAAIRMLVGAALNDSVANTDLKMFGEQMREHLYLSLKDYETSGAIKAGMARPAATMIFFALRGLLLIAVQSQPEDWDGIRREFINDLITVIVPSLQP